MLSSSRQKAGCAGRHVRYLHPYLVSREVDWDRAFVEVVPQLLAARDSAEYRRAVEAMLAPLRDPVTRVVPVPDR